MTAEQIELNKYQKAIEYRDKYWGNRNDSTQEAAEFGYIVGYSAGVKDVMESEEYRLLVHEARQWRRHQEIVKVNGNKEG